MSCDLLFFVDDAVKPNYVFELSAEVGNLNRIYNQYSSDYNTVQWYNIIPEIGSCMSVAFQQVATSYNIDLNDGAQLDVIGRLIDVNRAIVGSVEFPVYECGDLEAECGGSEIQCSVQFVADDSDLEDAYYKTLLKAKVARNTSDSTIDSIILATKAILSSEAEVRLRDSEDMTFTIEVYDGISGIELILLTKGIIPTPQGVRLRGFLDGIGIVECGDSSLQCGDESAECIGLTEVN